MTVLNGRVAIVTGASSGIGAATSLRLAREGMNVVLAGRRAARLDSVKSEIEEDLRRSPRRGVSPRLLTLQMDITSPADRDRLVQETISAFGRVDALVNSAGYGQRGPIEAVAIDDIRRNFETNVFGLLALTQLVIPIMRKQGGGRIVIVGSVAGKVARPFSSIYDATKHALEAFADGLRGELMPFGIRVVLIEPGFILTEFLQVANEVSRPVFDHPGPYAPFFSLTNESIQKASSLAGRPSQIAALIARALTARRPRARYAAPGHAHLFLFLKRILPDRILDALVYRQLGLSARKAQGSKIKVQG